MFTDVNLDLNGRRKEQVTFFRKFGGESGVGFPCRLCASENTLTDISAQFEYVSVDSVDQTRGISKPDLHHQGQAFGPGGEPPLKTFKHQIFVARWANVSDRSDGDSIERVYKYNNKGSYSTLGLSAIDF